jgi:hypothetical protein
LESRCESTFSRPLPGGCHVDAGPCLVSAARGAVDQWD